MKEEKSFKEKVKKHKKKILVGIGLASLAAVTSGSIKYKEEIKEFVTNIRKTDNLSVTTVQINQVSKSIENISTEENIVNVRGHVRDLPTNHNASEQQRKKLAQKNNIYLGANQTFVKEREKNIAA